MYVLFYASKVHIIRVSRTSYAGRYPPSTVKYNCHYAHGHLDALSRVLTAVSQDS